MLKICHLVEFTLAVEPVLAIMIFITEWLIERAGNHTNVSIHFAIVFFIVLFYFALALLSQQPRLHSY